MTDEPTAGEANGTVGSVAAAEVASASAMGAPEEVASLARRSLSSRDPWQRWGRFLLRKSAFPVTKLVISRFTQFGHDRQISVTKQSWYIVGQIGLFRVLKKCKISQLRNPKVNILVSDFWLIAATL